MWLLLQLEHYKETNRRRNHDINFLHIDSFRSVNVGEIVKKCQLQDNEQVTNFYKPLKIDFLREKAHVNQILLKLSFLRLNFKKSAIFRKCIMKCFFMKCFFYQLEKSPTRNTFQINGFISFQNINILLIFINEISNSSKVHIQIVYFHSFFRFFSVRFSKIQSSITKFLSATRYVQSKFSTITFWCVLCWWQ